MGSFFSLIFMYVNTHVTTYPILKVELEQEIIF